MEEAIFKACNAATKLLDEYAPVEIVCERYAEKQPHAGNQEAVTIRARLPWQKQPLDNLPELSRERDRPRHPVLGFGATQTHDDFFSFSISI